LRRKDTLLALLKYEISSLLFEVFRRSILALVKTGYHDSFNVIQRFALK
jgi:hypothetical protein